jgi:hypothetical protein
MFVRISSPVLAHSWVRHTQAGVVMPMVVPVTSSRSARKRGSRMAAEAPHMPHTTSASAHNNPRSASAQYEIVLIGKETERGTTTTYDASQPGCLGAGTMALQASKDAPEETHTLRVRSQRAHRVRVLFIQFDSPSRQGDSERDGAPPGPRLGRPY